MAERREPYIIGASSSLLAISFVIVTGIKLTGMSARTFADEFALLSAVGFMAACFVAYLSLRTERDTPGMEKTADYTFLLSMLALFASVVILATSEL